MGVGDVWNCVGVMVSLGKPGIAGAVAAMRGVAATGVGAGSNLGKPRGAHAEQRIRMKRKTRSFIFNLQ
jgi:hypothetical protein